MKDIRAIVSGGLAVVALSAVTPTCAQGPAQNYDVPAQELKYALRAVTRQAGYDLVATADLLEGRQAAALKGRFTPEQAVERLLGGSDLVAEVSGRTVYIRKRGAPPRTAQAEIQAADDIVVTGTRISGAAIASPTITVSREAMLAAGQHTLADVIRNIPQNFGGGHNPGVGLNVPESAGVSTGAAVTLNLRGLGSDATLTLLNGHRLSYSATNQAIDLSVIPVAAIQRIEIVADGASALYGSDAVAGVANVVLRKDFDGLETRARLGAATDGGYEQQHYGALGGRSWEGGGFLLAYEFGRDTPVLASQRDYAADRAPGLYLYPAIKRHNLIASAHQALTPAISLEIDALYNRRQSRSEYALDTLGDVLANGARTRSRSTAFVIAPSLNVTLGPDWSAALTGMISEDRTRYGYALYADATPIFEQRGCYCNKAKSLELSASGTLFALPAGAAKLAIGAGFRTNDFHGFRTADDPQDIHVSQDTYYAFGELNLPLIAPEQESALGDRLNLSGAVRYERYPQVDDVLTPKLGLVYSPSGDLDLKASWGKSFKAPRLFQQYNIQFATLYTAASRGGSGYPGDATALLLTGGNPELKPEHATTWSATAVVHPAAIDGLRIEASYFNIDYRDRIVTPIPFPSRSLADPIYADLVDLAPSAEAQAAVIAGAGLFQNATAQTYDPAKVIAIIHNTSLNAARQSVSGVDGSVTYDLALARGGNLSFMLNASYIRSQQRLSALQPAMNLAGTIFNIPHFRGRGGVVWTDDSLSLAGFVNHIGPLRDPRAATVFEVGAMTTLDLAARYRITGGSGLLDDIGFALSVHNLFDQAPSLIRSTLPFEAPYDSTNHSAFGRVVSFEVSKTW